MKAFSVLLLGLLVTFNASASATVNGHYIKIKDLSRFISERESSLIGYGIVVGLAGTGDSKRNLNTQQAIKNALRTFGVNIPESEINSKNVASVMVTSKLKSFVEKGSVIDVKVSSLGDSRSLAGGTLLITPLKGVDEKIYVLAQGAVSVGGYKHEFNGNIYQKNHPTVGVVVGGGIVEKGPSQDIVSEDKLIKIVLDEADVTTAWRVEETINNYFKEDIAEAITSTKIHVNIPKNTSSKMKFLSKLENIEILPAVVSRIVINERTGTIVAGGGVKLGAATISHGSIKLNIKTTRSVEFSNLDVNIGGDNSGVALANSEIDVVEGIASVVEMEENATVFDLVTSLKKIRTSTKDIIVILQALKASGSMHVELIIQ
ncbi:MAG: flagellar basal body P-ring protein FlgI [Cycloclasticus sp.]|jgi:Flagellar basal-body P-ring protein